MLPICLLSLLLLSKFANSDPHFVDVRCLDAAGNYSQQSPYQTNLNSLLLNLISATGNSFYSSTQIGDSPDITAYGLYYCRGDVQTQDCHACVASAAATVIANCPGRKEAIIWYDECTLRYANRVVSSLEEEDPWIWRHSDASVANADQFGQLILANRTGRLIMEAAYNYTGVKFFGRETTRLTLGGSQAELDVLVQCSPGVGSSECETCLRRLDGDIPSCCGWGSVWAKLFSPSCLLMYNLASTPTTTRKSPSSTSVSKSGKNYVYVVIAVIAAVCAIGLLLAILWCVHACNESVAPMQMLRED